MSESRPFLADLAIRYYPVLDEASASIRAHLRRSGFRHNSLGRRILCVDTETWTDERQALRFGAFGLYTRTRERGPYVSTFGLFAADGMEQSYPDDFAALRSFCREHGLLFLTRREFIERHFFPECYGMGAVCLGFNLPFDLSRIAEDWGVCEGAHRDSFWLRLSPLPGWPRVRVKPLNERAAILEFMAPRPLQREDGKKYRPGVGAVSWFAGRFLDCATLSKALSGDGCSLDEACRRFGVPQEQGKSQLSPPHGAPLTVGYCEYALRDVQATFALYEKLAETYRGFPFASFKSEAERDASDTPMTALYSPASLSKALLRKIGRPAYCGGLGAGGLSAPSRYQGYAAASFYGGRMDCGVRRVRVPVTVLDFTSQYPAVFLLLGLWPWLMAETLGVREDADYLAEAQALIDRIAADPGLLYTPEMWGQLAGSCQFIPDGDLLPSRSSWGAGASGDLGNLYATLAPLYSSEPMWYALPDVAASAARTGKAPRLLRAFTGVPQGEGSHSAVKLHNTTLDPLEPAFLSNLVTLRKRLQQEGRVSDAAGVKVMINAVCFGIFAEVNTEYFASPKKSGEAGADIRRPGRLYCEAEQAHTFTGQWEKPGGYCNWLLASLVTAGGRLLLSLLEGEVLRLGGAAAWVTIDSAAVVTGPCEELSSLVPVSPEELQRKFDSLNPFERHAVPEFLRVEQTGIGFCVSPARYCITGADGELLKANQHGCSGIIDPEGRGLQAFADDLWRIVLAWDSLDDASKEELWSRLPERWKESLRRRFTVRSPKTWRQLARLFPGIRPFGFLQSIASARQWGGSEERRTAYGPYQPDGKASLKLKWWDPATGQTVRLVEPGLERGPRDFPYQRVADFVEEFECHRVLAAVGPDGTPCLSGTRGLLLPHPVRRRGAFLCGKESSRIEGTLADEAPIEEPVELVSTPTTKPLPPLLLEAIGLLAAYPKARVAAALGIDGSYWERICANDRSPGMELRHRIFLLARGLPEDAPPCAAERKQAILRAAANLPRPRKP